MLRSLRRPATEAVNFHRAFPPASGGEVRRNASGRRALTRSRFLCLGRFRIWCGALSPGGLQRPLVQNCAESATSNSKVLSRANILYAGRSSQNSGYHEPNLTIDPNRSIHRLGICSSWISLSFFPSPVRHSDRPLELAPRITPAAVEGELNS